MATLTCPTCGTPVRPGDLICLECGANLARTLAARKHSPTREQVTSGPVPQSPSSQSPPPQPAVAERMNPHRTIICVDVDGDPLRTRIDQLAISDGLYRALGTAFARSGIDWQRCYYEDRGDGAVILAPPDVPKEVVVTNLVRELVVALDEHNDASDARTRIRLRLALHAGEVRYDGRGLVGTAIMVPFRLLEAEPLKRALRDSPGDLAVITSQWFFQEVIRHISASHPESYRQVQVEVKETSTTGWIYLPRIGELRRVGRYRVIERLGAGGYGVTYLGTGTEGRKVAIWVLSPAVAGDSTTRRRLAREVDTMQQVHSPHVAEILDADVTADQPYVVTRYLPGRTLKEVVEEHGPRHGQALQRLAVGLASALSAIHGAGLVLRNLEPGNVMLVDDEPIVIDLGFPQAAATRPTASGMVIGTPGYLAPEIIEGEDARPASDVFAWAATVAYAATGRPPFGSGTYESIFFKIMQGTPDLDGVPEALTPLLRSAMTRNPAERPTAQALVQEARRIYFETVIDQVYASERDTRPDNDRRPQLRSEALRGLAPPQPDRREQRHRLLDFLERLATDEPTTVTSARPPRSQKLWQAFTDGLGGTLDLFGGISRPPEPLPAFETTLANDVHELCRALGLIPGHPHEEGPGT